MARAKRKWYAISTDLGLIGIDRDSGGYPYIVLDAYNIAHGVQFWKNKNEAEEYLNTYARGHVVMTKNPEIVEVEF